MAQKNHLRITQMVYKRQLISPQRRKYAKNSDFDGGVCEIFAGCGKIHGLAVVENQAVDSLLSSWYRRLLKPTATKTSWQE